ncbi:MAG: OB-fold nucleic acid binding domain-containing protein, partial [Granulosicoccaceae bacterium]
GVEEKTATYIFDLMEKFAGYGFNKSHSAAYALVSYHTAYLKAHYPAAFMAAVLSSDMDNTSKVVMLIDECRSMALEVLSPNVNSCEYAFTSQGDADILYGLGAIKGVGESALESIIEERNSNGLFKDLFDFCRRIDARKVNRRVLEALIRAGALDGLGPHRAVMMQSLGVALKSAEQHLRNEATGVADMFGGPGEADDEAVQFIDCPEWDEDERLNGEKETLGLYLTGHPITRYLPELGKFIGTRLNNVRASRDRQAQTLAGLVVGLQTRNNKSGDRMAFLTLDDRSGRIDVAVFGDEYKRYQPLIAKDKLLVVKGPVNDDEFSGGLRLRAEAIYDIDQARENYARQVVLSVDAGRAGNGFVHTLREVLAPYRDGHCPVAVDYDRGDASARLLLGEDWYVHPTDELLHRLRELVGEQGVQIQY